MYALKILLSIGIVIDIVGNYNKRNENCTKELFMLYVIWNI